MPAETGPNGRRVIVTGAAGGIGRAIIAALAAADCRVAACDADGAGADAVAGTTTSAEFDVRDRAAVRQGVAGTVTALAGCDALAANAGVVDTIHRAERFSEDDWRLDLETNPYGAFNVVQATFEELVSAGDGRVVLVSSVGAERGIPGPGRLRGRRRPASSGWRERSRPEWAPRGALQRRDARDDRHPEGPRTASFRASSPSGSRWLGSGPSMSSPGSSRSCSRPRRRTSPTPCCASTAASACHSAQSRDRLRRAARRSGRPKPSPPRPISIARHVVKPTVACGCESPPAVWS